MPANRLLDLTKFAALSPTKQFFNGLLDAAGQFGAAQQHVSRLEFRGVRPAGASRHVVDGQSAPGVRRSVGSRTVQQQAVMKRATSGRNRDRSFGIPVKGILGNLLILAVAD